MKRRLTTLLALMLLLNGYAQDERELIKEGVHKAWDLTAANERIEEIRKGDQEIRFTLPNGKSLKAPAQVDIELSRHEFNFGCSVTQTLHFYDEKESFYKYHERLTDLFNLAVVGFYWSSVEPQEGKFRVGDSTLASLDYFVEKGFRLKGHPLMWHNALPKWLMAKEDPKEIDQIIRKHIKDAVTGYPQVTRWDLYNEAPGATRPHVKDNGITRWVASYDEGRRSELAVQRAVADLFEYATELAPDNVYTNNHYTYKMEEFKRLNQYLNDTNTRYDIVGIQTHMHEMSKIFTQEELWGALEDYKQYGKPIHLTELTVPSFHPFESIEIRQAHNAAIDKANAAKTKRPYLASTPLWEKFQAEYLVDYYTLAFSHPAVEAVIMWNLSDKDAWQSAAGGIIGLNQEPKPAYNALMKLIHGKWHTHISTKSTKSGEVSFRGFYGDYECNVKYKGKSYTASFNHASKGADGVIEVRLR